MTNEVKKYRFFNPWVPPKYRKGINGKKILVLGASYYCYKITCPHFQDCTNVEKKTAVSLMRYVLNIKLLISFCMTSLHIQQGKPLLTRVSHGY